MILFRLGPTNFYDTGRHLLSLPIQEDDTNADDSATQREELGLLLVEMLNKRFKDIYARSTNSDSSSASQGYLEKLDLLERGLYSSGQFSSKMIEDWLGRRTDIIETGKSVASHLLRKRKAHVLK